jgi:hypothetical protein
MIESRRACPELVERGRLKVVQDYVAAYFQPSLRDWVVLFESNPGLASWAKFSRPCGTILTGQSAPRPDAGLSKRQRTGVLRRMRR